MVVVADLCVDGRGGVSLVRERQCIRMLFFIRDDGVTALTFFLHLQYLFFAVQRMVVHHFIGILG